MFIESIDFSNIQIQFKSKYWNVKKNTYFFVSSSNRQRHLWQPISHNCHVAFQFDADVLSISAVGEQQRQRQRRGWRGRLMNVACWRVKAVADGDAEGNRWQRCLHTRLELRFSPRSSDKMAHKSNYILYTYIHAYTYVCGICKYNKYGIASQCVHTPQARVCSHFICPLKLMSFNQHRWFLICQLLFIYVPLLFLTRTGHK